MKPIMLPFSICLLLASANVLTAELHIPMAFEYIALDDTAIEPTFFSHQSRLVLTPGHHNITLRYHDMIEDDFSDSQTFVKSAPFIISFTAKGDEHYQLQATEGSTITDPKAYAIHPEIVLTRHNDVAENNINNRSPVSYQVTLTHASLLDTNHQMMSAITGEITRPIQQEVDTPTHVTPQQMLEYWWLQADDSTRQRFTSWTRAQP